MSIARIPQNPLLFGEMCHLFPLKIRQLEQVTFPPGLDVAVPFKMSSHLPNAQKSPLFRNTGYQTQLRKKARVPLNVEEN